MKTRTPLLALALALAATIVTSAADALALQSPNGQLRFRVAAASGRLTYDVTLAGKPVIEPSAFAILIDGVNLAEGVRTGKVEQYKTDATYATFGVHSTAIDRSNGARLAVTHIASGTAFTLEARAFDSGIAFRYVAPGPDGKSRVTDETTEFRIPAGSTLWSHDLEGHYEGEHKKRALAEVAAGDIAATPLTFRLPGGTAYGSITEGSLIHYAGMALKAGPNHEFHALLGHAQPPSYPFRLRFDPADIARLAKPAAIQGTITSPWRIVMAGVLNTLVNSDIVGNVSAPPDPKYFPEGLKTPWLKPGRAVWAYLDGGQKTLQEMKDFSKMAGELGFQYNVVEGFWRSWSPAELKEFCDYSREQGVGVVLWAFRRSLGTPEARREFFDRLSAAGAAGAKIDFFDHEALEVIDLYEDLLREAAARHMVLDFHGANKPTGLSRTWPNELTREGIRGLESSKTQRAVHQATLPFTRMLAGPADYTPMHFGPRRNNTSIANQIASAAIFTSPMLVYAANPRNILSSPAVDVIKTIPSVWDETIVLPGSAIGELVAFARRSGDTWFLAVMNGVEAKKLALPLSFLGDGAWHAVEVRDSGDTVELKRSDARRGDSLPFDFVPGGGTLIRFSK
ncbi:MAG TPA: glycoside hydrolase family 97 catalytic domain-containing protein [Candidatus Solibacter sp.]